MDQSHPLDPTLKVSGASATPAIRLLKNDFTALNFEVASVLLVEAKKTVDQSVTFWVMAVKIPEPGNFFKLHTPVIGGFFHVSSKRFHV